MDKTNILVVDDRRENIDALSALIAAEDVRVLSAQSANEALELLINHEFALALLDVQMPGISGFELARLIRGVKRFSNLPVIFVTAHQREQSFIFEGYETGAVDLLFKPLDPHVVRSKVRVFVQLDQQARELKKQMEVVERLRQEAEGANLAKSQFLANMSHEIRTPLGAVLGFSEVLSQPTISSQEREHCVEALRRNGQLLVKIIDDILDLSKVEAQRIEIESVRMDLQELLRDVESTLSLKALEKGIALQFTTDSSVQGTFVSDPIRIKQILFNIIGNAVKFTHKGSVHVDVKCSPDDVLRILVADTGIGLSREAIQRLFRPFSQADSSTRRTYGGTGLGLVIARKIAQALGGDVKLIGSIVGDGSQFEITLQLKRDGMVADRIERTVRDREDSGRGWTDKSILVVDDSEDNRSLIEMYLRSTGLRVLQAASGNEALNVVSRESVDLILMDIQMPKMDGHQTTRQMRSSGTEVPIIAFTAHAMRDEIDKCHKSGCDTVLTKPVSREDLLASIDQFL